MEKKEFKYAFQITKKIIFEVRYSTAGSNDRADFATTAAEFDQRKTDYERCGQCQADVLPESSLAMDFYKKWDHKHLGDLTDEEYVELMEDIEDLKNMYNYEFLDLSRLERPYIVDEINWNRRVALSKMNLKTKAKSRKSHK